jgi:hypothetical protein
LPIPPSQAFAFAVIPVLLVTVVVLAVTLPIEMTTLATTIAIVAATSSATAPVEMTMAVTPTITIAIAVTTGTVSFSITVTVTVVTLTVIAVTLAATLIGTVSTLTSLFHLRIKSVRTVAVVFGAQLDSTSHPGQHCDTSIVSLVNPVPSLDSVTSWCGGSGQDGEPAPATKTYPAAFVFHKTERLKICFFL